MQEDKGLSHHPCLRWAALSSGALGSTSLCPLPCAHGLEYGSSPGRSCLSCTFTLCYPITCPSVEGEGKGAAAFSLFCACAAASAAWPRHGATGAAAVTAVSLSPTLTPQGHGHCCKSTFDKALATQSIVIPLRRSFTVLVVVAIAIALIDSTPSCSK